MPYTNDHLAPVHRSNSSRALKRNPSTPTFINLDDCKPILSTTTTNTSTNSSANGKTAFVFTSSRTLRALQDQEEQYHSSSPSSLPSSPYSPPASPGSESSYLARSRASLTLSQVVKHSEGAIDARSLLGPKMRAAGFVNLPNTLGSRSDLGSLSKTSSPVLPMVSVHALPTPSDPPIFPPMVFIDPSTVTSMAMWQSQSGMDWSMASQDRHRPPTHARSSSLESTGSSEFTPGVSGSFLQTSPRRSLSPPRRPGPSSLNGFDSYGMSSVASSSSTLVSSPPSSTALSCVSEADEDVMGDRSLSHKGKAKAQDVELSEFPFPSACDSPRSQGSHGSRASSATASPTIMNAVSPSSHPISLPASVSSSRQQEARTRRQRSSSRKTKNKSTAKPLVEPTPSFAAAKRPGYSRQYSLTELCDSSPFVWMTKPEMFAPPAPISRSPPRTFGTSVFSSPAASKPRPPVYPPQPQPKAHRHRKHHGLPSHPDPASRPHRIVSEPIRMSTIPAEHASSDQESEHPQKANRNDRGRGRDTRGKVLSASETAEDRATAQAHEEMDREKVIALEGLAALELAHRERAQEYSLHLKAEHERSRIVKQKLRVHRKARDKALLDEYPSESETTMVDNGHISLIKTVR